MNTIKAITVIGISLLINNAFATPTAMNDFKTIASLQGDWKLAPANMQEGGATKKGPAAKLINTSKTAISFKVIGKGSTVQENLLPGTGKEMATMYHCNNFKKCTEVQAKHYCAKQNQPELVLDSDKTNEHMISMSCDKNSAVCKSNAGHVHNITHELSDNNNHLMTTYTIFKNGKFKKNSIYHFVKK